MNTNPIVRNGYLWDDALPTSLDISQSRDYWKEWLETHKKIRFDYGFRSYSAFKDDRGLWVAQKRVSGKLRQKRLGNSQNLAKMSLESLYDVALELASDSYYQDKQSNNPEYLKHIINKRDAEIESLKQELHKAKSELETLKVTESQKVNTQESYSETQNKKLTRLYQLVADFKAKSKDTRDWTQANKLILAALKVLDGNTLPNSRH